MTQVAGAATLTVTPTSGTVDVAGSAGFTDTLTATGGDGNPVTFTEGSGTPDIVVDSTGGLSTGGTLAVGSYTASGSESDDADSGSWSYTLTVTADGITVSPTTGSASVEDSGTFTDQLGASGNDGTPTFTQTSGTPDIVVGSTGALSTGGTLAVGTYTAEGTVTDPESDTGSWSYTLTVTADPIAVSPTSGSVDVQGSGTYTVGLVASGNTGSATFTKTSGSSDLSVGSGGLLSTSGTLAVGSYTADGTVTDPESDTGTWSFTLTVTGDTITVSPTSASVSVASSAKFTGTLGASGTNGTVTFSQSSGTPQISVDSAGSLSTGTTLAVGTYTATGTVGDAEGDTGSWSYTLTVTPSTTATALAASLTSPTVGQQVTYTATVTPTPNGGTVEFDDNGAAIACTGGDQTVDTSTGEATCEFTYLNTTTGNPHPITATYQGYQNGSQNYYPASPPSSAISVTVLPALTQTTATFSPGSSTYGLPITYTATVASTGTTTPVTPDNGTTVTFSVGALTLCNATLSSGSASCSATNTPAGSQIVTATYAGDANFKTSTGPTSTSVLVRQANSTTSISISSSSVPYGTFVTYSVEVVPGSTVDREDSAELPTGTVDVFVSGQPGSPICTVTLDPSNGDFDDCDVQTAPVGADQRVTATYAGDNNFTGTGSVASIASGTLTVTQAPQTISFSPPTSASVGGPPTTLSATGGGSGNPVTFSVDPSSGSEVCSLSGPDGATVSYTATGTCVIDANQAGNGDYSAAPQVSASITVVSGGASEGGGGGPSNALIGPANAPPPLGLPLADFGTPVSWTIESGASPNVVEPLGGAKISVTVPDGALPIGTTVSLYPVKKSSELVSKLPAGKSDIVAFALSWEAPDGTIPVATRLITITITDSKIVIGDAIYVATSSGIGSIGKASVDGKVAVTFRYDPTFLIASNPQIRFTTSQLVVTNGVLPLELTCSAKDCSGSVTLSERVAVQSKKGVEQEVVLATASYRFAKSNRGTVKLSLTPLGKTLLAHASTHPVQGSLRLVVRGGATLLKAISVT